MAKPRKSYLEKQMTNLEKALERGDIDEKEYDYELDELMEEYNDKGSSTNRQFYDDFHHDG